MAGFQVTTEADVSENPGNFTEVDIRNVALEQYHTRLKSVFDGHALLS